MTKYNELNVVANKNKKRVGRGISGGQGKTAGRGTKGQKARTGKKLRSTFMGGSGALMQRIPKSKGFKSLKAPVQIVYLDHLNALKDKDVIDNFVLYNEGYIASPYQAVKVIARGELTESIKLYVDNASKGVQLAIVKVGGTFVKTAVPLKQSTKNVKK
ncbi:MAG TPA: 50S ribosomal protein L15 [Candidatus Saccharibacteria bacterium]|nr:50S ribosomal protein L15 [Candidatus Saccharibacteria bacterium]